MFKLTIDQEFKTLIPPLTTEEIHGLEEDLQRNGCLQALVVWKEEGILLDGHNRHEICTRLGISYKTTELSFPDRQEAAQWIIKHQLGRRNLSESQRSLMAARLAKLAHGANRFEKKVESPIGDSRFTRKEAADALNIGTSSLDRAKQVLAKGSADLVAAVDKGEVTVAKAASVVSLPKSEQLEAAKTKNPPTQQIKKESKKEEKKKQEPKESRAFRISWDVIGKLQEIDDDDPNRAKALTEVKNWIEENI